MSKRNNLLLDESPLVVQRGLARKIGLTESIIIQQIHYWINQESNEKYRDGRYWVYKTFDQWQKEFDFVSTITIKRIIGRFEESGILISSKSYNKHSFDRTKWYTINYDKFNEMMEIEESPKNTNSAQCIVSERYDDNVSERYDHIVSERYDVPLKNTILKNTSKNIDIVELNKKVDQSVVRENPVSQIFDHWKAIMSHPKSSLDQKRKDIIKRALGLFSKEDLMQAIDGCSKTPHNMGDNDRGEVYDGIHIIFKDAHQIERFMKNAVTPPRMGALSKRDKLNQQAKQAQKSVMEELAERIRLQGGMDELLRKNTRAGKISNEPASNRE